MVAVVQIPNLPPILALAGTSQFEVVQAGVSSRVTALQIADYVASVRPPPGVLQIDTASPITGGTITSTGTIGLEVAGVTNLYLAGMAPQTIKANVGVSPSSPSDVSLSAVLDMASSTQGSILYRGGATWSALPPGTAGQVLVTNGPSLDPGWGVVAGTPITAALPLVLAGSQMQLPSVPAEIVTELSVSTLAALKALTTRPSVVTMLGHTTAGDGGGGSFGWEAGATDTPNDGTIVQCTSGPAGRYKRIYTGPVHTSWWGQGISALKAAWAVSKRVVLTPGEEYVFSSGADTLTATDEDIDIDGPMSHFMRADAAGSVRFLSVIGTYELDVPVLTINATGNQITVDDPDNMAGGILPGMTLKVMSMDELWHYASACWSGQFAEVASVSVNTVTFTAPLRYANITLPNDLRAVLELEIDNVVDNGAGLFRVSCATPHFRLSNQKVYIDNLPSMPTAEGEWVIAVIDDYTFDLVGSTFAGVFTTGGMFWPTFNFSPANGMHVGKLRDNLLRVNIGDLRMTPASASGTLGLINIINRAYMNIQHGYVPFIRGQLFGADNCFGGIVSGKMIQRGPGGTTGYGYVFNACENIIVDNPQGGYIRHLVDGGGGGKTDGIQGRCSITVRGGYSIGSQAGAIALHQGCDQCHFDGFMSRDGDGSVVPRGIDHIVTNTVSLFDGSGVSNFIQQMYDVSSVVSGTAGDCRITVNQTTGFEVGMKIRIDGINGVPGLTNGYYFISAIIDNDIFEVPVAFSGAYLSGGTVWSGQAYSGGMTVTDPVIILRPTATGAIGTGQYTGMMTVIGGYIEAGGSGSSGVSTGTYIDFNGTCFTVRGGTSNRILTGRKSLSLNNCKFVCVGGLPSRFIDARSTPDVVIAASNVTIDNPAATLTSFYDASGSLPNAGSRIGPLTVTGAMTALVNGQNINNSRPYQTGPIRVAGVPLSDRTMVNLGSSNTETIASGVITVTSNIVLVAGEGGLADDLVTINGGITGDLVLLRMSGAGTITVKDGTGNIALTSDRVLDNTADTLLLERRSSTWNEVAFSNNT